MSATHWFITGMLGFLFGGCAGVQTAPTQEERQALAPTGKLRVGVFTISPMHVTKDPTSGELKGTAIDLGKELARRIGVPFEVVGYTSVATLIGSANSGQWDVVLFGIHPASKKVLDFSAPYMEAEVGYLVRAGSSIAVLSDVDRPGIRIAVQKGGGIEVYLSASLKSATIVQVSSIGEGLEALRSGKADAVAAIKTFLFPGLEKVPGSRVLDGRIFAEPIGFGVPKGRPLSAAYVRKYVEDVKSEGLVKAAIERAGLRGVVVAPLQ
jgi:polar amino acid transport system substrate-binding protein